MSFVHTNTQRRIENLLKQFIPEVKEVVAEEGWSYQFIFIPWVAEATENLFFLQNQNILLHIFERIIRQW